MLTATLEMLFVLVTAVLLVISAKSWDFGMGSKVSAHIVLWVVLCLGWAGINSLCDFHPSQFTTLSALATLAILLVVISRALYAMYYSVPFWWWNWPPPNEDEE